MQKVKDLDVYFFPEMYIPQVQELSGLVRVTISIISQGGGYNVALSHYLA